MLNDCSTKVALCCREISDTDDILYKVKRCLEISHVLNEQGTGYEHIFSSVQTFNINRIEKWGMSSERASKN